MVLFILQALAPGATTKLDAATLEASDAPSATMPQDQVVGCQLADVMVACGLQPSKSAGRRLIKVGYIAGNIIPSAAACGFHVSPTTRIAFAP